MRLSRKKVHFVLFSVLLTLASFLIVFSNFVSLNFLQNFYHQKILAQSKVKIFMVGDSIKAEFEILPKDIQNLQLFSANLGVSTEWSKGLDLKIDKKSTQDLANFLPLEESFIVTPHSLEFTTGEALGFLEPTLLEEVKSYATGTGELRINRDSNSGYEISIKNPEDLLQSASLSGQLSVYSPEVSRSLFQLSTKLDKIILKLHKGSLKGVILVK